MTAETAGSRAVAARPARWRRMGLNAALLAVVLVVAGGVVGSRSSFLPDEGAIIIQARMLARGEGWVQKPPLPQVDPTGRWFPLDNVDVGAHGFAPLAKHPVYALLAAAAYRVAQARGVIGLSMIGTFFAALVSAALARRFHPSLAVPCLWVVGVASPLLFDGLMALSTTMAAALGTAAVLLAVTAAEQGGSKTPARPGWPRWRVGLAAAGVLIGVMVATLLRTEAALFGLGLAGAAVVVALINRRTALFIVAGAAAGGAGLGRAVERTLHTHLVGRPGLAPPPVQPLAPRPFLAQRLSGFTNTWLQPSKYAFHPLADACLVLGALLLAGVALEVRRSRRDPVRLAILGGAATLATGVRLLLRPWAPVPGLLVAFPLLGAGLVLLRRRGWTPTATLCLGTAALFSAAVIATQYPNGGSLEWGGRYFAMGVPIAVPALLDGVRRRLATLPRPSARVVAGALAGCSAGLAVLAVASLASEHADSRRLVSAITGSGGAVARQGVVVTNVPWIRRLAWTSESTAWLHVPEPDLGQASAAVRSAGIGEVTLVTVDLPCPDAAFAGWTPVSRRSLVVTGRTWNIEVLEPGGGAPACAGTSS